MTELDDSIDAAAIPAGATAVAGYGDGLFVWSSAEWARFPNAVELVIVVSAAHVGDILDVETGDATPDQVPGWVKRFNRSARRRPTVYSNRSTWPLIVAALEAAGMSPASVDWWASTLDGTRDVPGAVAVQYHDTGGYDQSVILDPSWLKEDPMPRVVTGDNSPIDPRGNGATYLLMEPWKLYIPTPAELADMNAAYGATQVIPQGRLDRFIDLGNTGSGVYQQFDADAVSNLLVQIKAELDQVHAGSGGTVDLSSVTGPLEALAKHLGVGTA